MNQDSVCPQCHNPITLFAAGTLTPLQFFSADSEYKIASGGTRERLPIYVCQACGHGFTPLDMDASQISKWYKTQALDDTFVADEQARRKTARTILRRAEACANGRGRLLDIGAGPGIFVSEAVRHGWSASGVEPSRGAVRYGQEHYGVEIKQGETSQLHDLSPRSFDIVTLFDVIEHVADPRTLLHTVAGLLRPGGLLILTTPAFDSLLARIMGRHWYCIFPAHIQYFTWRSLFALLETTGFEIVKRRTHTRYLSSRYFGQRLRTFLTGRVAIRARTADRSLILPVNFGDEFEIYARRRAA